MFVENIKPNTTTNPVPKYTEYDPLPVLTEASDLGMGRQNNILYIHVQGGKSGGGGGGGVGGQVGGEGRDQERKYLMKQ